MILPIFFDSSALISSSRVDIVLVDCCQPRVGVELVGESSGGRKIYMDIRRMDFNDIEQLIELPQAYLILHDRRTLGIFGYTDCIPFLVKEKLRVNSGSFLIHGLKPDLLFDATIGDRLLAHSRLPSPQVIKEESNNISNTSKVLQLPSDDDIRNIQLHRTPGFDDKDDTFSRKYCIIIELPDYGMSNQQEEEGCLFDKTEEVDKQNGVKVADRLLLPCHPMDSLEDIRLRLFMLCNRRVEEESNTTSKVIHSLDFPVGFEVRFINSAESANEMAASRVWQSHLPSKPFSKPFIWFPAKYATLIEVLTAACISHDGDYSSLLFDPTASKSAAHDGEGASGAVATQASLVNRKPVLRAHGSPGLPLRSYALAESFGAILSSSVSQEEDGGGKDNLSSTTTVTRSDRGVQHEDDDCDSQLHGTEPTTLLYTLLPSECCPLTNTKGLVAFHSWPLI